MMPNKREVQEAVSYIFDACEFLDPIEDEHSIEALLIAIEYLTAEVWSYEEIIEYREVKH